MDTDSTKSSDITALPAAGISETLGLLEFLDDNGGKQQVYKLAYELSIDTDVLLTTLKAAEIFGFIEPLTKEVVLTKLGKSMIETEMNTKKQLLLEQLRKIVVFEKVKEYLENEEEQRISKDSLMLKLQALMPNEKAEDQFETLINWGRWGEFLGYSKDDDMIYLDQG